MDIQESKIRQINQLKPSETKNNNKINLEYPNDSFVKSDKGSEVTKPEIQQPALDKTKLLKLGGTIALAGTVGFALGSKQARKVLAEVGEQAKKQLDDAQSQIRKLTDEITDIKSKKEANIANSKLVHDLQDEIAELKKVLSGVSNNPENSGTLPEVFKQNYLARLQDAVLGYDPHKIVQDIEAPLSLQIANKIFKFSEIGTPKKGEVLQTIDLNELKRIFKGQGFIDIELPKTSKIKAAKAQDAFIGDKIIKNLGEKVDTDMTLAYGERVGWSNQKIARDIMQNFYDGHGNTLDGVKLSIKKLPNGKTKVKISGDGLFNYENLQYLGSGTKLENPYNAGGFGEGSKILVANMLGKGDAKAVKYSCADWSLEFSGSQDKKIQRLLTKITTPIEGNSIEFETENENLVDAIIDSVNYFQHSKNPDFSDLSFDSKNFGFKFLGAKDAKGNIYLTQRFEFEGENMWTDGVDNLSLIFKRKPDPQKFQEITGSEFRINRDRTKLTFEDVKNLTHYFAHEDMSDDEIIEAINSTKPLWGKIDTGDKQSAIKSFLEGLIEEAQSRQIAIDFGNERFAAMGSHTNETVYNTLKEYNYIMLPECFNDIGMRSTEDIFKQLSVHKALTPTDIEVKKMKLLEYGIEAIQEDISTLLSENLAKFDFKIDSANIPDNTYRISDIIEKCLDDKELLNFVQSNNIQSGNETYNYIDSYVIKELSSEKLEELATILTRTVKENMIKHSKDPNSPEARNFVKLILNLFRSDAKKNIAAENYFRTLKDLYLITKEDVTKPRYIFDRNSEIAKNTLGEAIIEGGYSNSEYIGHWIDRGYLNTSDYNTLLGTWVHEICHKSGGDGTPEFTYALTDMLRVLLNSKSSTSAAKIKALNEAFQEISK